MLDCIIGIDPGASGGIAYWTQNNQRAMKMPKIIEDFRDTMSYLKNTYHPIVFLEKLSIRPDDIAADGNMGKLFRVQRMMQNYEQMKATLSVMEIPYVLVHPMKWQSGLKLRIKGEEKADRKRRFRETAQILYPDLKVTLWNADALLIMHFGRHIMATDRKWVLQQIPQSVNKTLF